MIFLLDVDAILEVANEHSKMLFLMFLQTILQEIVLRKDDIQNLLENFNGIVIIDEAYIDFSVQKSWIHQLKNYPNFVVLQTLSKAWGLAFCSIGNGFCKYRIYRRSLIG